MTRKPRSLPRPKALDVDPLVDPVGAFLVGQRPEVLQDLDAASMRPVPKPSDASERITDAQAIASLLSSFSADAEDGEDDLIFELLYLETLIAAQPLKSRELLAQLGALGEEVREGLLPPGIIDVVALRQRTRRLRQHLGGLAGRISAAAVLLLTTLPMFGQQAAAAEERNAGHDFQIAAAPVVRVIDATSGQGLSGVTIKSMEEKVLGTTDGQGQAVLAEDYRDTDLMSLEKNGYELALLERSQLAARNIVSMKPIGKDEPKLAGKPSPMLDNTRPKPMATPHAMPRSSNAPRVVMNSDHQPTLEAPSMPMAPKAPQIRIPLKPRKGAAAAMTTPKPRPMAAASTRPAMLAALPTHPKPPTPEASMGDTMTEPTGDQAHIDTPNAPKGHTNAAMHPAAAPHHMAKPNLPAVHDPVMALPARPRQPMQAEASAKPMQPDTVAVAVPKRVPAKMHTTPHHHHMAEAPAMAGPGGSYRVRPGDSLSKIAQRYLGSARRWPELYAMNRGHVHDPALIRVGQSLALPGAGSMASGRGRTYVVRPGDSLFKIARIELGNGGKWQSLYRMNRDHLRSARLIFPGQRIQLG